MDPSDGGGGGGGGWGWVGDSVLVLLQIIRKSELSDKSPEIRVFIAACRLFDFGESAQVPCTTSVSWDSVSVSDKPAHVEAEGEEAGPQQVAQSGQVRDGEVVRVHPPAPHPVNHPVRHVEKNHHLNEQKQRVCL